ncbi:hypothetical protein SCATT_13840 [Streptantibioticus cattleyicolor NRRL 8057 = DSM 46488]|uniref:Uncharacterized protein n=1 Tax=Streptantibioticus cattleyicolor (strain ATCC 35852 / DSM 46488 / JCM 4925 / NBRC 14057 / NRRL 8057) TaxID=1003195 RepID=G8WW98_STREN|nr:hypothetical protein SCATT_13840 [Streptantibioticus cattleyicolor NRRL 8057 = DSM 46488]
MRQPVGKRGPEAVQGSPSSFDAMPLRHRVRTVNVQRQ